MTAWNWDVIRAERTVYEDDDVLVLDKPSGLAVHPTRDQSEVDLSSLTKASGEYLQAAHRIDKVTSGALLLGKSQAITTALQSQFGEGRGSTKAYLAFATTENKLGEEFAELLPAALIDLPLLTRSKGSVRGVPNWKTIVRDVRSQQYRLPSPVEASGRKVDGARTRYMTVWQNGEISLLALQLVTGRTHQIRAHLQAVQHPVLGDPTYSRTHADRTYLHAWKIGFDHPTTGERIDVQADPGDDFWEPTNVSKEELLKAANK